MDDVRLSNIARTDDEIYQDYLLGLPASDAPPPSIVIISPDPGVDPGDPGGFPTDIETAKQTPIVVEISAPNGLGYACLVCRYPGDPIEHVIYRRGAFRGEFVQHGEIESADGVHVLTCLPSSGWPSSVALEDITFDIDAIGGGSLSDIGASS